MTKTEQQTFLDKEIKMNKNQSCSTDQHLETLHPKKCFDKKVILEN
jgi:hypothetical protein